MKLAYLYGIELTNPYLSTYSHYPITKNISIIDEIFHDKPLLIVGIKKAKELYPNKIDLDNNHIENNIYWCYSPEEYLSEFLKKYEQFIINIHDSYLKFLKFEIIDIFFKNINQKGQLIDFIKTLDIDIYYQVNKMLYCYSNNNSKIFIINLNEFFWFDLINFNDLEILLNDKHFFYDKDLKIFNYFTNLFSFQDSFFIEKTIPYFIYLKHQNNY
jgi:hypothetical protein